MLQGLRHREVRVHAVGVVPRHVAEEFIVPSTEREGHPAPGPGCDAIARTCPA